MTAATSAGHPEWARAETRTEWLHHTTRDRGRTIPRRARRPRRPASVRRATSHPSIRPDGLQGLLRQHGLRKRCRPPPPTAPPMSRRRDRDAAGRRLHAGRARPTSSTVTTGRSGCRGVRRHARRRRVPQGARRAERARRRGGRSPICCSTTSRARRWCRAWRCRSRPTRAPSTSTRGAIASTRRRSDSNRPTSAAGWQTGGTLLGEPRGRPAAGAARSRRARPPR